MARSLDPGAKRNLLRVGGVFAVGVIAVVAMLVMQKNKPPADQAGQSASVVVNASPTDDARGAVSATIRDRVDKAEADAAENAEKTGKGHVPKDLNSEVKPVAAAASEAGPGPSQFEVERIQAAYAKEAADRVEAAESARDNRRREGLLRQLTRIGLLGKEQSSVAGGAGEDVQLASLKESTAASPAAAAGEASSPAAGKAAADGVDSKVLGKLLVRDHAILVARTISEADSYRSKKVIAEIAAGPLKGAQLFGVAAWVEEGASCHFDKMTFDGRTYDIDADALNEATAGDVVDVDVDHRWVQRLVLPTLTETVKGYAQARANPGQEVVNTASGSVVTTPKSTGRQAVDAGVAKGLDVVGRVVDQSAAKPERYKVLPKMTIGILFNKEVRLGR